MRRRTIKDFLNLGTPHRAWEFVGLSNERDRPSLGKPSAQPFTDVLAEFGWRDSPRRARSTREEDANVLQPALLANGILGARITRLSDDSAFTALALRDQPLDDLVTQLFQRVLSRAPSGHGARRFTATAARRLRRPPARGAQRRPAEEAAHHEVRDVEQSPPPRLHARRL